MSVEDGWEDFWNLYRSGEWEPQTRAAFEEFLGPDRWLVDIGAWIGPTVLWGLDLGASVLAVEPDPVALAALRRIESDRLTIVAGAVAVETGTVRLATNPVEGGELGDSMTRVSSEGDLEVPAWTLPDLFTDLQINPELVALVKLDVEGYEEVLWPAVAPWLAERGIPAIVERHAVSGHEVVRP